MRRGLIALACVASPALAQDQVPPPDYFVTSAMETSTAQILAVNCATISINPGAMSRASEIVLDQLEQDGFTPENLVTRMADPSDAIGALQDAFLSKHGLADGATEDLVCAAAAREIEEGTGIGALLLEVGE
ncbi:DUF5333 family protein [Jannaschia pohangensis]|uniref:Peptidoglycan binding domain-containing protein n=1 Tax=Jannaschia pohangensis TaxID=390807 RepID=A0A1I3Q5Y2_9RHOB|nr:DUF5333 family protein [Jannaschia pohangensis]SFJ28536.1 hypothetical protein SAMN04488095_2407 [Jannaschia pohangensis]